MKTTVITLVSVFMVLITIKSGAQTVDVRATPKSTPVKTGKERVQEKNITPFGSASRDKGTQLKGVEGEIYVGAEWPMGVVVLRDGSVINNYFLRYNLFSDQMQFISGKDTLAFASPQELNTVSFGGHTFVYENYQCENSIRQGFFELIEPGKNKLLLKRLVTYEIPDPNNPDNESSTKFLIDNCYFISKPGEPANKMMCNRKSALSFLNDHNEEIEEYLRITGNKVRNLDELKKLVAYYNALDEHE